MMAKAAESGEAYKSCADEGGNSDCSHGPPAWSGMPAPRSVMVLSWEDVWLKLCDALGRQPTRGEVELVFEEAVKHMDDALVDDFWLHVERRAEEYASRDKKRQTC